MVEPWHVYVIGTVFAFLMLMAHWLLTRGRRQRLRELEQNAQESERHYRLWLRESSPCPTCGGHGRVSQP
jgi:hypothetical protein